MTLPEFRHVEAAQVVAGPYRQDVFGESGVTESNAERANSLITIANDLRLNGQVEKSVSIYWQAMQLQPDSPVAHFNLGEALLILGKYQAAAECLQRAVGLRPDIAEFHNSLGIALKELGRLDDAVVCYLQASRLKPGFSKPYANLGLTLLDLAQGEQAIGCFQNAIELDPTNRIAHSGLLFARNFVPGDDPLVVLEEHRRWNDIHAAALEPITQTHVNERSPERRLRIGYVSPFFRDHCQSLFTVPLLSAHDHQRFEIYAYSDVATPDTTTQRLRDDVDQWRDVHDLSDEQLANTIREDKIDVLVDLTMHMAGNRLLAFARKPAPIQVCWLAYPGTTGLAAMDYRISDPYLDPPELPDPHGLLDQLACEQTMRLPASFWCYDPRDSETTISPLPSVSNCGITFGYLNNFCKVNELVLRLWSEVLMAVAGSRLVILAGEGSHRQWVLSTLADAGVDSSRVKFVSRRPRADYLRLYHEIDISLDSVPSNGHTTSLDSLWMGVPVVTLVGKTASGRAGLSQLTNLGLTELIARTPEQYVRIASELARDQPRLTELRNTLRVRMEASPLMDAPRFSRDVEAVYRDIWKRWCECTSSNVGSPAST